MCSSVYIMFTFSLSFTIRSSKTFSVCFCYIISTAVPLENRRICLIKFLKPNKYSDFFFNMHENRLEIHDTDLGQRTPYNNHLINLHLSISSDVGYNRPCKVFIVGPNDMIKYYKYQKLYVEYRKQK